VAKQQKPRRLPKLRHHRATGRAYVELSDAVTGERWPVYCGRWGTDEAERRYSATVDRWVQAGRRRFDHGDGDHHITGITVAVLAVRYLEHARIHYRRPDGSNTSRLHVIQNAVKGVLASHAKVAPDDFGPLALQAVRDGWVAKGLARKTVNDYTAAVCLMFRWGVAHELCRPESHTALTAVAPLARNRSAARETAPKTPVPMAQVRAAQKHVSRQVSALIDLQLLTGARSGELLKLRPCDLDTTGDVWFAILDDHKTAWATGKPKLLAFGPRAQKVLAPFLKGRAKGAYLFSPREAEAERKAAQAKDGGGRRPNQRPNPRMTERVLGDHYTPASYRKAVQRGCEKAYPPPRGTKGDALKQWRKDQRWHPHRLRHNAATEIRRKRGKDAAKVVLGVTEGVADIYAEMNREEIFRVMRVMG
jgi:integrase